MQGTTAQETSSSTPSAHSWDRVQRRGVQQRGGTERRTSQSPLQLSSSVSHLAPEAHTTKHTVTRTLSRDVSLVDRDVRRDRQELRQTGGVMASVDSTGSSVPGRLRSGDLLHAGLTVVLLLGELYFSLCLWLVIPHMSTIYLHITAEHCTYIKEQVHPSYWLGEPFYLSIHVPHL